MPRNDEEGFEFGGMRSLLDGIVDFPEHYVVVPFSLLEFCSLVSLHLSTKDVQGYVLLPLDYTL